MVSATPPLGSCGPCLRETLQLPSGALATVSTVSPGTFAKMPSFDTRGIPSRTAVAATQRSAS